MDEDEGGKCRRFISLNVKYGFHDRRILCLKEQKLLLTINTGSLNHKEKDIHQSILCSLKP